MKLTGSRLTLTANVCALVVATVVAVEGIYIIRKIDGHSWGSGWFASFFPAIVMLVIRSSVFSWLMLVLYTALASQMFYQVYLIQVGYQFPPLLKWGPLGYLTLYILFSLVCLALYGAACFFVWIARVFEPFRPND
jgi:hypothetical protein